MKLRIHSNDLGLTKMIAGTVLLALGALNSSDVLAYKYVACGDGAIKWKYPSITMYIDPASIGADTQFYQRLISAMEHWNNVQGSNFTFRAAQGTGHYSHGNYKNEIYFSGAIDNNYVLAYTHLQRRCEITSTGWKREIYEADITFNDTIAWNPGSFDYSNLNAPYNFEVVALHEFGHALGFRAHTKINALIYLHKFNSIRS